MGQYHLGHSDWSISEQGGHDFWLSQNGHGANFRDRDLPEDAIERLMAAAERYGEVNLYVCDDGLIYA